MLNDRCPWGR
jgi:hypothetical protein